MNQWINQATKQWINEAKTQWISQQMTQWISESTNQWSGQSMNQSISESTNQYINRPLNQGINETMNRWMNEWMNEWLNVNWRMIGWLGGRMDGWMDGWMDYFSFQATSSLSDLFAEASLLSAGSSLSGLLSGLLLLDLPLEALLWFLQSIDSSRSCYAAFSNLQLQPRIAHRTRVALWSRTTSRAAATLRLATSSYGDSTTQFLGWSEGDSFSRFRNANSRSRRGPGYFSLTSSSKKCSAPVSCLPFLTWKPSARYSSLHFLSATFQARGPQPQKQRPYCCNPSCHLTRKEEKRKSAEKCFHPWIHTLPNCHSSQLCDNGWLTWWCGDMMRHQQHAKTAPGHSSVTGSYRTKFLLITPGTKSPTISFRNGWSNDGY